MSPDRPSLFRIRHQRTALLSRCKGNHRWPWFPRTKGQQCGNAWNHQRTTICIQNRLSFCLIGSVNDLYTIACPSVSSLGAIAMKFDMDIIVTYGTFSIIFILVTIDDVVGDNWCGRFGLWPFRSVAVSVCGRFGLWPFRFVAVSVCGRSGLWPFRFVAVSVVVVSACGRYDLLPYKLMWFGLDKGMDK